MGSNIALIFELYPLASPNGTAINAAKKNEINNLFTHIHTSFTKFTVN
ncbi:hypothetical protein CBU02nite_03750 [Clostridium butyricum]|jgi:hypothetical protein|uniref:Uncharacterized protein n=1 Tax=Clostridium butyricum TaxID=1492 RepID=A0A512TI25_CLOBU|nr:hypothetical protein CBU02nite_03750 [Clostridium butyricum]